VGGQWVRYSVDTNCASIHFNRVTINLDFHIRNAWLNSFTVYAIWFVPLDYNGLYELAKGLLLTSFIAIITDTNHVKRTER
jgi:hypothetical protein